jgi:hypothetical protein
MRTRDDAPQNRAEIGSANDAEGPDNLDFLFYRRLYSVQGPGALTYERRTGGQVRRDGL